MAFFHLPLPFSRSFARPHNAPSCRPSAFRRNGLTHSADTHHVHTRNERAPAAAVVAATPDRPLFLFRRPPPREPGKFICVRARLSGLFRFTNFAISETQKRCRPTSRPLFPRPRVQTLVIPVVSVYSALGGRCVCTLFLGLA